MRNVRQSFEEDENKSVECDERSESDVFCATSLDRPHAVIVESRKNDDERSPFGVPGGVPDQACSDENVRSEGRASCEIEKKNEGNKEEKWRR